VASETVLRPGSMTTPVAVLSTPAEVKSASGIDSVSRNSRTRYWTLETGRLLFHSAATLSELSLTFSMTYLRPRSSGSTPAPPMTST
jgi:hypothetical protein